MKRRNLFATLLAAPLTFFRKAEAKLPDGAEILKSFDARDWARAFVAHVKANPAIATDEETMATWFANALMRGYDEARWVKAVDIFPPEDGADYNPDWARDFFEREKKAFIAERERAAQFVQPSPRTRQQGHRGADREYGSADRGIRL